MATLLMRTPELSSSTDDVGLSNAHTRLYVTDTAPRFSHLPPTDIPLARGSNSCSGRTRRAKSAHKKQPQRGLGVAQLEKLRLQEQGKQEAASLATLQGVQSLPPNSSYSFPEPCSSSLCFQAAVSCHVNRSSAFHLLSEPCLVPSLSLATSADCSLTSFVSLSEGKASPSLPPSKNSPQSSSGSSVRQVLSVPGIFGRPFNDESAYSSLDLCSPNGPVSSIRERAVSKVCCLEKLDAGTPGESDAASGVALRAMARPNSSMKHTANASLLSSMYGGPRDAVEDHVRAEEGDEVRILVHPVQVDGGTEALRLYPVMTFTKDGGTPCTFMDSGYSDKVHTTASPPYIRKSHCVTPMVGSDKLQELSSFQSFDSNGLWSPGEKIFGRKRSWIAMQGRHNSPGSSDLCGPKEGGDEESVQMKHERFCAVNALDGQSGVHYTTGVVRTALGKTPCMLHGKVHGKVTQPSPTSQRQDSGSPSSASGCLSDISVFPTPTSLLKMCTGKDSCSSASPTSPNSVAALDAEELSELGVPTSNFLSLGLSSFEYSALGNHSGRKETIQVTDHCTTEQDGSWHSTVVSCLKDKPGGNCEVVDKDENSEVDADKKPICSNCSSERNFPYCSMWTRLSLLSTTTAGLFTKVPLAATGRGLEDVRGCLYHETSGDLDLSLKLG